MANIINKKNELKSKYQNYLIYSVISYIGAIIFLLTFSLRIPGISMPGFIVCGLFATYFTKKFKIIKSGIKGEKITANLLAKLPENFFIFNDIKIQADGKESELDNIVVSPQGIFVIETKNHNGKITGDIEDQYWIQHKVGQKGTPYQKKMYSPLKQVKTHTWRLSQFFNENGLNLWVDSAVYFSNSGTIVKINNSLNSNVPIFSYDESDDLLDFILTKNEREISEQRIKQVNDLLQQQAQA